MPASQGIPSRLEAISTRWSLLRQARSGGEEASGDARLGLVLRYRSAVFRYVEAMIRDPHDAEDVAQNVMVRLLEGDFAGADPSRGRFRDLLKTAIRNMVRNHWSRQKRRKTVDFDVAEVEGQTDDRQWLASWRTAVMDIAWKALQQEQRTRPGSQAYTVLKLRAEHPEDSSDQLAERLSKKTGTPIRPDALRQKLRRSRARFADLLIAEIANGLADPTPQGIEEELGNLGLLELLDAQRSAEK
jgi:RNA polymerase sigma factor (sigma-70 family)